MPSFHESNSMRVTLLGTLPPIRGLSSYCLELTRALADECRVDFLSFQKLYPSFLYPGGDLKEDPTFPALKNSRVTVRRKLNWYDPTGWFMEGLTSRGALLHVQWWSLPLASVAAGVSLGFRLRRRPVVMTLHNVRSHEDSAWFDRACRGLCILADHVIVHTASSREVLSERHGVAAEKISVIPHGPLDFHVRKGVNREAIRSALGVRSDHLAILLFGAVRPYKGVETAFRALAEVIRHVPGARLLVAGKLWESWDRYERLARELGVEDKLFLHLDYVPSGEVHRYFEAADLVLLPYKRFEAQSGVGATALSFAKPLIVTDVGGLPDLVEDRRFVVPAGDVTALADTLGRCLASPGVLEQMAKDAEKVSQRMGWPGVAERTRRVYSKVLMKSCGHPPREGEPSIDGQVKCGYHFDEKWPIRGG